MRLLRRKERRGRRLARISWVDIGTWAAALATAIGLWLLVNIGERTSERTLRVQIDPENLPAGMVITNPIPEYAEVRVSGSGLILSSIDAKGLRTALDLAGAKPGVATYSLDPKRFELPRKVEVNRVTPSQVTFHLDRMAKRSLPVRLERIGEVPAGLRLKELALLPEKVDVSGPKSRLDGLQAVVTVPFDLANLAAGRGQVEVELVQPGGQARLKSPTIRVRSVVEPVIVERTLRRVKLTIRGAAADWQAKPEGVNVVVRGPELDVDDLELEPGDVYVETGNLNGKGPHRVKPQVELPEGIELVRVEPAEVALRASAEVGAPGSAGQAPADGEKRT